MSDEIPNTSPWIARPEGAPAWFLVEDLTGEQGTLLVRCFAVLTAFLADELELPVGTLPALLRAAIDDYGRAEGPQGIEPGLHSIYEAVRLAFG